MKSLIYSLLGLLVIFQNFDIAFSYACQVVTSHRTAGTFDIDLTPNGTICREFSFGDLITSKDISLSLANIAFDCSVNQLLVVDKTINGDVLVLDYCAVKRFNTNMFSIRLNSKRVYIRSIINYFINRIIMSIIFAYPTDPTTVATTAATTAAPTTAAPTTIAVVTTTGAAKSCGVPLITPSIIATKIVGGTEAVAHSWPWQVLVTDGKVMCGGSLISNQYIVTAAHCSDGMNPSAIKVTLGAHDISGVESDPVIAAAQIFQNPNYNKNTYDSDITVIKLASPVTFSSTISPICLPPVGSSYDTPGTSAITTGWGVTNNRNQDPNRLRQVKIPINTNDYCSPNILTQNQICAGDKFLIYDSCQGDSGGPLTTQVNGQYYLTGVVSSGIGCGGQGVYTKVTNYVNWINSIINPSGK